MRVSFVILVYFLLFYIVSPVTAQVSNDPQCKLIDKVMAIIQNQDTPCYNAPETPQSDSPIPGTSESPLPTLDPSALPQYDPTSLFNNETITYPEDVTSVATTCLINREYYNAASVVTQVPWEVLAGIHYREGSCNPQNSSVGGRRIGSVEPDVRSCTPNNVPGQPIPIGNGCGFSSLYSSLIYTGNHLKAKIGKVPSNFPELTQALSRYNGGGNSNCRGNTPYQYCPALFPGEDDAYVMNRFDDKHTPMYLRYCADHTLCNPPREFSGLGALTVASALNKSNPQP